MNLVEFHNLAVCRAAELRRTVIGSGHLVVDISEPGKTVSTRVEAVIEAWEIDGTGESTVGNRNTFVKTDGGYIYVRVGSTVYVFTAYGRECAVYNKAVVEFLGFRSGPPPKNPHAIRNLTATFCFVRSQEKVALYNESLFVEFAIKCSAPTIRAIICAGNRERSNKYTLYLRTDVVRADLAMLEIKDRGDRNFNYASAASLSVTRSNICYIKLLAIQTRDIDIEAIERSEYERTLCYIPSLRIDISRKTSSVRVTEYSYYFDNDLREAIGPDSKPCDTTSEYYNLESILLESICPE